MEPGNLFLLRESREGGVLVLRFFVSGVVRRAERFFFEQKTGVCSGRKREFLRTVFG